APMPDALHPPAGAAGGLGQLESHAEDEGDAKQEQEEDDDPAEQQLVVRPHVEDDQPNASEPEEEGGDEGDHRVDQRQRAEDGEDALLAVEALAPLRLAPQLAAYEGEGASAQERQLEPVHEQEV